MLAPTKNETNWMNLYKEFISVVNEELYRAYNSQSLIVKAVKGCIQIYLSEKLIHVISMSKSGDAFVMCDPLDNKVTYSFTSMIIFREYFLRVIDSKLDEELRQNTIDQLLNPIVSEDIKINLGKISVKWFTGLFNSIAYDYGNYEDCSDTFLEFRDNGILIGFGVDCHRLGYFKKNFVQISRYGSVVVKLCDHLVGSDLDLKLKEEIELYIKK